MFSIPARIQNSLLQAIPRAPITIDITVTFIFHSFFLVLRQDRSICFSFLFLLFLLYGLLEQQNPLNDEFFFFGFGWFGFFV